MFQVSLVLEENWKYIIITFSSKHELSLLFKTLDALDISEEALKQILKGMNRAYLRTYKPRIQRGNT